MTSPPQLPKKKDRRTAMLLNLALPGAGQFYLGQWVLGSFLAVPFVICFLGVIGLFLFGMAAYLQVALSGEILEGNNLEILGGAFHLPWLIAFGVIGILVFGVSMGAVILMPRDGGDGGR